MGNRLVITRITVDNHRDKPVVILDNTRDLFDFDNDTEGE
jgi:hypothetical protein